MATKKVQKNRLNENNEFDVIHYETEASVVLMADGTTAEDTINDKQNKLTFDETPTVGSTNPVTSGGVATDMENKIGDHNTSEDAHANLLADMVTASGGATMTMEEVFGEGPYTIEFTDDEGGDFTASYVPYDNSKSGLEAEDVQNAIDETVAKVKGITLASLGGASSSDVNAAKPALKSATLTAAGWDATALTQTVTVAGVLADEMKQIIQPAPASASQTAYYDAGIICTAQAANSLTFTCSEVPTVDLTVLISIQEVQA